MVAVVTPILYAVINNLLPGQALTEFLKPHHTLSSGMLKLNEAGNCWNNADRANDPVIATIQLAAPSQLPPPQPHTLPKHSKVMAHCHKAKEHF